MTEQFDRDIKRALEQGTGGSLQDWTFSPQMRSQVMDRIAAEQSGRTPAQQPQRTPRLLVPRPVLWTAVAAAALLLALRLPLGGMGGSAAKQESAPKASTAAADQAATQPADAKATAESAPATTGNSPTQPQAPAPGTGTAKLMAPGTAGTFSASTLQAAPARPVTIHLASTAPARALAQKAEQPRSGISAITAPPTRLALQPAGKNVVELNSEGLKATAPDGARLWSLPIAGAGDARLLPAPDGHLAVVHGSTVSLVSAAGGLDQTLTVSDAVAAVAFSADGRTALATPTGVDIYRNGKRDTQFNLESPVSVAFGPDGAIAALSSKEFTLRSARVEVAFSVMAPAGARTLAFGPTGAYVLAGNQAYDRTGKPLWSLPFNPAGAVQLGDLLIAYDDRQAAAVAVNGEVRWQTALDDQAIKLSKVVTAADGHAAVILGATADAGAAWVISPSGELTATRSLPVAPVDAAFTADALAIMIPDTIDFGK